MRKKILMVLAVIVLGAIIAYFFSVPVALVITFVFMVGYIIGRRRKLEKR